MKVTLDLDEQLVKEAFKYTEVTTKRDLVRLALEEFVRNHSRKDMRELRGKIAFSPDYDYKGARTLSKLFEEL